MTLQDYEFLLRIEREKEDGKAYRRIARRQYTREERKRRKSTLLVILAGLCAVSVLGAIWLDNSGDDPTRVLPLQTHQVEQELPPQILDPEPVTNGMEILGEFELTAYCSCPACCGPWALNRPKDENGREIVYTASGAIAEMGTTVAVDPEVIPLGTDLYIDGMGWFVAQDTGNFSGKVIDIYFSDHAVALEFGRQNARVSVVSNG